jgi:mannobiose 2-epimerase
MAEAFSSDTTGGGTQGSQHLRDWMVEFRDNLLNCILQFWIDHAIDCEYGGAIGWIDQQGKPVPPGTKSVVVEGRTLWSFSQAFRRYPLPAYKEFATHTLQFLREKMWDAKRGGYYWMVDREGHVVEDTKLLNPMSYVLEGLAEYSLAFHDGEARKEALDLFEAIDRAAHDDVHGGYHLAFTADWQWIKDYQPGPNASGSYGRKSSDWHLGLLEAFATLYDVTRDRRVRARVEELLNLFLHNMVDTHQGYLIYYFTEDWKPYDINGDSAECMYGLDMETSWLLTEAAELVGRRDDPEVRRASLALVDHSLRDAFDHEHGGLYHDGPAAGPPASKRKEWWQQAETLVGSLNAYQLTADPKYWAAFEKQARFVLDDFTDHQYGEWYSSIDADGKIDGTKGDPWREQYHQTRACLEIIRRLGRTL